VDFWQLQQYAAAFSGSQQRLSDWTPLIQTLLNEQDYGIVAAVPGVFLLQREMPSDATARALWQTFEAEFAP
ncbi:MAG: hypothetical protein AAF622_02605, partial [Cyanobacteria bacterium P01_C01_bin.147]